MKKYLLIILLILISCEKDQFVDEISIVTPIHEMIFDVSESIVVDGQSIFMNIESTEVHTLLIFDEETNSVITKESFNGIIGLIERNVYINSLPKKKLQLILKTTKELEKTHIIIR